jgi:GNAT superfamily N-acetyltransferase
MSNISFRDTPVPADAERVRKLARDSGGFSAGEIEIAVELVQERVARGLAASGYHFLFAEEGGDPKGYACYGPIPLTAASWDLYWIAVPKNGQGNGIGRRLMAEVERQAKALGARHIYIDTSGRADYARSQAFYEAAGYRLAANLPDFYAPGDAKLIFVKRL